MGRGAKTTSQAGPLSSIKLKSCPMCGKTFIATPAQRVCRDCRDKEYQMEREIVNYVRDHPGAQPAEIIEATGASEAVLRRMIEEGRFIELGNIMYPCKKCGKPISSGKYCRACYVKMKQSLEKAQVDIKKRNLERGKAKAEHTYSKSMRDSMNNS
ncbi:MAG: flagellar protein [Selenomonadaceae bacterium]|nr:flagellar protein [Selenomonadaceae bacterium]